MSRPVVASLVVLSLLLVLPAVAAQGHDHGAGTGSGLMLIADTPEDGRAWVGDLTHFSYVILDDEDTPSPQPHNDVYVTVTLNGVEFYSTRSAHDYDGVGGFDVVFPVPGTYNVTVEVPGETPRIAHYEGYAVALDAPVAATLDLEAPTTADAGDLQTFTYSIRGPDGAIIPHTDARVEIRRLADDFPVLDVHTHSHEDAMTFDYAFEKAGPHLVRITAYTAFPANDAVPFAAFTRTHLVTVTGDAAPLAVAAQPPVAPDVVSSRSAPADAAEPLRDARTVIMTDPASGTSGRVGPFSQVRMSTVIFDPTDERLVQHTNHEAELDGPYGTIFRSASLHEYDGVLEIMSANQMVGAYQWSVGTQGLGSALKHGYEVLPANAPAFSAGPQFIETSGIDRLIAGAPGELGLFAYGIGRVPFQHGEVGIRIDDAEGLPLIIHKLHTHSTGTFEFRYTPPAPGEYTLQLDPFDVHGAPTPQYHGATLGASRSIDFTVSTGERMIGDTIAQAGAVSENVPDIGLALGLVALTGALVLLRRRHD